jgi:esterase/lipase
VSSPKIPVSLSERHQPSGQNSHFTVDQSISFEAYEKQTQKMLLAARTDIVGKENEYIVEENAPFELTPSADCLKGVKKKYRRGILLTHGLKGTPYSMRALGKVFQENCFRVMAILLPGHATRPGDLLDVTWEDWMKAEAFGVNALASEVDEIYLSGFSAGGTVSIYQSLVDHRVMGLFLFSPAIAITPLAGMASIHKVISWAMPRAQWVEFMLDEDHYQYESFPLNAVTQIYKLTKKLQSALKTDAMPLPVFLAVSEDDATVSTPASIAFFEQASNPANKMVLYSAHPERRASKMDKVEIIYSAFPDQHIISSAHTAIIVPPDDLHFGKEANPMACSRYFNDAPEKYALCKDKKEDFLGEITDENLKKGVIRRLMYNPSFDALKLSLKQFIDTLD